MTKKHGFLSPTIVKVARSTHNPWRVVAALVLVTLTADVSTVWAQENAPKETADLSQFLSVGASGLVAFLARSLDFNQPPADCAPCSRSDVPAFDRWSIHDEIDLYSDISDYLLVGLALGTWIDLTATEGSKAALTSIEAVGWTLAATEITKVAFGRKRPAMFTDDAPERADERQSLRSMPSGHTSVAFALVTSYILSTKDRDNKFPAILAGAAAVSIGVLRVAAGRHFPSDVVVGAALGMGGGAVMYQIRF